MVVGWSGHLEIIFRSTKDGELLSFHFRIIFWEVLWSSFWEVCFPKHQVIFVTNGCKWYPYMWICFLLFYFTFCNLVNWTMIFAELLQNILLILYVAVYVYALTFFSLVKERTKLWNLWCKQLRLKWVDLGSVPPGRDWEWPITCGVSKFVGSCLTHLVEDL